MGKAAREGVLPLYGSTPRSGRLQYASTRDKTAGSTGARCRTIQLRTEQRVFGRDARTSPPCLAQVASRAKAEPSGNRGRQSKEGRPPKKVLGRCAPEYGARQGGVMQPRWRRRLF